MKKKLRRVKTLDDTARERIVLWRRNARMTQKELGDLCGRNAVWVSRYENGYFDSDLDTLQRMAAAFNQTIYAALNVKADPTEELIIERYRAITRPAARAVALSLLNELSGATVGGKRERTLPPARRSAANGGSGRATGRTPRE